eukprot:1159466-Pelagomonas_calceolata.AAC.8
MQGSAYGQKWVLKVKHAWQCERAQGCRGSKVMQPGSVSVHRVVGVPRYRAQGVLARASVCVCVHICACVRVHNTAWVPVVSVSVEGTTASAT